MKYEFNARAWNSEHTDSYLWEIQVVNSKLESILDDARITDDLYLIFSSDMDSSDREYAPIDEYYICRDFETLPELIQDLENELKNNLFNLNSEEKESFKKLIKKLINKLLNL
jgi:hypothetical protein